MRLVAEAAHSHNREVGICGEFAAAEQHTELLVGLGMNELSVASPAVPAIKERIRTIDTAQASDVARRVTSAATAAEVHQIIGR